MPALNPYREDAALIKDAAQAARAAIAAKDPWEHLETPNKVTKASYIVRKFSDWLRTEHKNAIVDRLRDNTVDDDFRTFTRNFPTGSYLVALRMLRRHLGVLGPRDHAPRRRAALVPYPEDAALIDAARRAAKAAIRAECAWERLENRKYLPKVTHKLRQLSDWLRKEQKGSIAGRLGEASLARDTDLFSRAYSRGALSVGFLMLKRHRDGPKPGDQAPRRRARPVPYLEDTELIIAAAEAAKAHIYAGKPWPFVAKGSDEQLGLLRSLAGGSKRQAKGL